MATKAVGEHCWETPSDNARVPSTCAEIRMIIFCLFSFRACQQAAMSRPAVFSHH